MAKKKNKTYVITSPNGSTTNVDSLDSAAQLIGTSTRTVANRLNSGIRIKGHTIETLESYLIYHKEEI